jgi:SEC-C motif-containing protein
VEFKAYYRDGNGRGVLHEVSRFARESGRWYYLDGEVLA